MVSRARAIAFELCAIPAMLLPRTAVPEEALTDS